MNDALDAAPEGPQTDTLVEQTDIPRAAEVKVNEPERKSLDDTLRDEVDRAVKGEKPEAKDKLEKAEDEPEVKKEPAPKKEVKKEKPADDAEEAEIDAPEADSEDQATDTAERKQTAYKEPPSGFDDAAKKEWEAVPESVRGAVHRRAQEMERGIHKYRQDAEQYESVREYADLAKQSGTDLPTALNRYVSIEKELARDPVTGLQQIVSNLGLTKRDGSPVTLRDVAANIMGQSPDQAASQQEATINRLTQQLQEVTQQIGGFSKHVEQQQQQSRVTSAESTWGEFQQANPRAAELEPQIAEFLTKYPAENTPVGERLQDAYDWATAKNPSVAHTDNPPLAQTQPTPRQVNPAGQKSISGAGGESRTVRKESSDDAIRRSIAKLTG